jgi:hypothetical protein
VAAAAQSNSTDGCDNTGSAAGAMVSTMLPTALGKISDVAEETTSPTAAPHSSGSSGRAV